MRIGSYNLYEGAQNTHNELKDYANQQKFDVLCIQEANDWNVGTPSQLATFSADLGFKSQVYGDSNTRFKLATLSRQAVLSEKTYTEGFWHSAVHIVVNYGDDRLNVWNIHLDPKDEDRRLAEAKHLMSLIDPSEHTIVTGDFNSLSLADQYPDELIAQLTAQGIAKFGTDGLRFDVTDYFAQSGFVDAAASIGVADMTVPTPANQDFNHAAEMRLDYAFVSVGLSKAIKSFDIPKNALTDVISDHYPIVIELE